MIFFLLCLSSSVMSISYGDLWFRTPYAEKAAVDPEYDPERMEIDKAFQEAIYDLGLTLNVYSHYFTILRVIAGLPFFLLSFLIIRRRSDRLMAVLFAMALTLFGAAGTLMNPPEPVRVRLGDIIPADIKLFSGDYLSIDESALALDPGPVSLAPGVEPIVGYSASLHRDSFIHFPRWPVCAKVDPLVESIDHHPLSSC